MSISKYNITSAILLSVAAAILFAFEWQIERSAIYNAQQKQRAQTEVLAKDLQTRMVAVLSQDIHLLYGLRGFIEANPNVSQEDYAKYAASLKRIRPSIRNIAAAPNLVVEYVYPLEGNEAALGLDYRNAPEEQRTAVYKAIREAKAIVAGPVDLVQGGRAIIFRLPVYITGQNGEQNLWGILAAPVDIDIIYKELEISELTEKYHVAIRGKDGLGENGDVFFGDPNLFNESSQSVTYNIALENGYWVLAMRPKEGWANSFPEQTVTRVAFICLFFVLIVFWRFADTYLKERLEIREQKKRALREKEEFLEILSHEIRSPLQGVLAAQKFLLENGVPETLRPIVETAEESGNYIVGLINDYLDLQRAESNKLKNNATPVDLRSMLHNVTSIVTAGKKEQVASIKIAVSDEVPKLVMLDEKKTRQVLVNLIGNSVKYTNKGYIQVSVTTQQQSDICQLYITIEDTGIGIEPAELETLFDRFTRSEGGESKGGSGLGLAIAKMLVDVMEGDISVKSVLGEGSRFTVNIPLLEPVDESATNKTAEEGLTKEDTERLSQLKVLVADDVLVNRMLLNAMLTPRVKQVHMAEDGQRALEILENEEIDLVILDIQMPVFSGFEVAKKMRENKKLQDIPAIGLTGEDIQGHQLEIETTGMDVLLNKPIHLRPLLHAILTAI
ncbi:ATP-binding protein [Sneathiella glossodoripedis]|uniref:ATP-binding protein n=1 Tax=Sneathiella glossodoripedis TaxID=418853 RepID=UPI000A8F7246|nr:ATP-binding protein [Sneathiella glossodoripedis]